jgi:hypothetical protein
MEKSKGFTKKKNNALLGNQGSKGFISMEKHKIILSSEHAGIRLKKNIYL